MYKKIIRRSLPLADVLIWPFVIPSAIFLKGIRTAGIENLPLCRRILRQIGVMPVRNHYYEPYYDVKNFTRKKRTLPGIDWNLKEQIELLNSFKFKQELLDYSFSVLTI